MRHLTLVLVALSCAPAWAAPAVALKSSIGPQPPIGAPRPWTPPVPQQSTTAGTRVIVLPRAEVPLVHIAVALAGGADLDPPAHAGLASAVATMLAEGGAGTRSGNEWADALAALGDEPNIFTGRDGSLFLFTVQTRNFEPALALIGDLLTRPRFADDDWKRTRARLVAETVRRRDEPRDIVDLVDNRALFGDDHPYGRPTHGTAESLSAMTVDDLRAFYAQHYGPRTVTFVLTGNVPANATKQISAALADWQSSATPPPVPAPAKASGGRLVLVDRPGAQQSLVRVSQLGIARNSRDYPSAQVLALVLAGSFTSRMVQNLREQHGYTYGVSARYVTQRAPGAFVVESAIRTDVTAPAIKELLDELTRIHAPLSAAELGKARALLRNGVVTAFGSNGGALNRLLDLSLHDLPLDNTARELTALQALTPALVAAASRALVNPTNGLTVVVVGDRAKIEAPLQALGLWKAIEHRDVDGNPLP